METLLDFSSELDVSALDQVAALMYTGTGSDQKQAQDLLRQFQDHPDAWQRVPAIISQSSRNESKYIALQILDKLISTRWKAIPEEQQQGIRNFVVQTIIEQSSDEANLRRQRVYVNKLNMTLVEVRVFVPSFHSPECPACPCLCPHSSLSLCASLFLTTNHARV